MRRLRRCSENEYDRILKLLGNLINQTKNSDVPVKVIKFWDSIINSNFIEAKAIANEVLPTLEEYEDTISILNQSNIFTGVVNAKRQQRPSEFNFKEMLEFSKRKDPDKAFDGISMWISDIQSTLAGFSDEMLDFLKEEGGIDGVELFDAGIFGAKVEKENIERDWQIFKDALQYCYDSIKTLSTAFGK